MDDAGPETTKEDYIKKKESLSDSVLEVVWRYKEHGVRENWMKAAQTTISNYRMAAINPGEKYIHIAADKLKKISKACDEFEKWMNDKSAEQAKVKKCDKPVLLCSDIESKSKELSKMANDILKEPKPAPPKPAAKPKEEKKEEKKDD